MLKAIETKYKGYRFRSRLEARWAVFFNALGVDWRYEHEGLELSDGSWYLPDFHIFERDPASPFPPTVVEIKASSPSDAEVLKLILATQSGQSVGYLLCGEPGNCLTHTTSCGGPLLANFPHLYFRHPNFAAAVSAARCARFEHGESPL
jgi:hypothetical protein